MVQIRRALRGMPLWVAFVAAVSCAKTNVNGLRIRVVLATDFDTALVNGLKLVLDGPDGGALTLAASAEQSLSQGGHRYTAEAKDNDGDGAIEYVVTFGVNPFTGREFEFIFRSEADSQVALAVKCTAVLEGSKQATTSVESLTDGQPITLSASALKTAL
ncbi:MAG: hypothetical protein HYY84_15205 [Deltaproteobacteria bacterium]|nr:hypothetical protein [Deltaproteobacteria bacterium]